MKDHELRIMSKTELQALIDSVIVVEQPYPEEPQILPFRFCPICGCSKEFWTGNKVSYPERWEEGFCTRCGNMIGVSDNSPYIHCLACPNNEVPY